MILLDTNVVSEIMRPAAARQVIAWANTRFAESAISSITIFELGAGAAMLPAGKRKDAFIDLVARTIRRFGPRVYSFDSQAAQASVRVLEQARMEGLGLHQLREKSHDLQLAGIALAYGMEFATRNVSDFRGVGLTLINPWEPTS